MERSEQIGELVSALAKAQGEFTSAVKESNNPYYGSKYADLSAVINAVRPALAKHGIALVQTCEADLERQAASVTTSLHLGEQWISNTAEAPGTGRGKKAPDDLTAPLRFDVQTIGATWTYLRRYTLQGLVGIPAEDDDGNSATGNTAPIPSKQSAENWKARSANAAKPPSDTPTRMEGNILTATVRKIHHWKTKKTPPKDYLAIELADGISLPGFDKAVDLVTVWHQSLWNIVDTLAEKKCEFFVATNEYGLTLNSIISIDGVQCESPDPEGVAQ